MLTIVGNKISLAQGEMGSFDITIKDLDGKSVELTSTDILTIKVRRKMSTDIVLSKTSESVFVENKFIHSFNFTRLDTINLPFGDYIYDMYLTLDDGDTYVLVECSPFIVVRSVSLNVLNPQDVSQSILTERAQTTFRTPFLASYKYKDFNRVHITNNLSDDIIEFN